MKLEDEWVCYPRPPLDSIVTTKSKLLEVVHHFMLSGMTNPYEVYKMIDNGELDYLFPIRQKI